MLDRVIRVATGCASALTGIALAATPAGAATLKGQVVGTPYVAGATTSAIPVLLSKESARRARLRSQVGVLVVSRRATIAGVGGRILPGRIRLGDRFTATAGVNRRVQRATYVRLAAHGLRITWRSDQLSAAELADLLAQTRRYLAALSALVDSLAASTQASLAALDARVSQLRDDLDATRRDLAALRTQLGGLSSQLTTSVTTLRDEIEQVRIDLQPAIGDLAGQVADLATALGRCAESTSVVGRICALETATGQFDPTQLPALTARVTQLSGALDSVVGGLTGLTVTGDLPAPLTGPITSALGTLAGLQSQVAGVSGTVTSLSGTVGGLQTTVGGLQTQLGAVDATALATKVGNLIGALGAAPDGLSPTAVTDLQSQVSSVGATVSGLQTQLGAVDVPALNATVGTVQGQVATLQSTVNSICAAVNGQALPVIGTLPVVGSVAGQLSAQLTDACP